MGYAKSLVKHKLRFYFLTLFLLLELGSWVIIPGIGQAQQLSNRSVTVSSGQASVSTTENFQFDVPSVSMLGSIVFEYCDNSPVFAYVCNAPTGLDASSAVLNSQTGNIGFSVDSADTTSNKIVLSRVSANSLSVTSTYNFSSITNPSTVNKTVFVRISTYASTDGSGANTDKGAVAFAVLPAFNIGAYVPPFLIFCTGITVGSNCSTASGDSIDLGILSTAKPSSAQSQFATGTNDPAGYVIYASGTTMTSGNNTINANASPAASFPGTNQFGINLRSNASPAIGQDPSGAGTGVPTASYNAPNLFTFNSGDAIASSTLPTDFNRMTVSYMVNVKAGQPAGVYATTLSYIATVQF